MLFKPVGQGERSASVSLKLARALYYVFPGSLLHRKK